MEPLKLTYGTHLIHLSVQPITLRISPCGKETATYVNMTVTPAVLFYTTLSVVLRLPDTGGIYRDRSQARARILVQGITVLQTATIRSFESRY